MMPTAARRNSGGNRALSAAHLARNDSPMKSTTVPTRATVLPPSSHAFARPTSFSMGSGSRDRSGPSGAGVDLGDAVVATGAVASEVGVCVNPCA